MSAINFMVRFLSSPLIEVIAVCIACLAVFLLLFWVFDWLIHLVGKR